jgi:amidase
VQVPPFDVNTPWVSEINGQKLHTYLDWMKSCYLISATGLPALSVPCGFTPDGLPVGLQLIGRHQDERGVLQLGYAFQQRVPLWKRRPPLAA